MKPKTGKLSTVQNDGRELSYFMFLRPAAYLFRMLTYELSIIMIKIGTGESENESNKFKNRYAGDKPL